MASIGRAFFGSKNLSLNGRMSCQTCHLHEFGSADGLPNAVGIFGIGEGAERAFSNGRIVPRNTLPLWGRGGVDFDVFFWDGKVDFSGEKQISQFGDTAPSQDALMTAVHLPPVEIREMIDDDDDLSRYKLESPANADELYERIVAQLVETEQDAVGELAARLEKRASEVTFHDVARSISAFIRSEFRLQDTALNRFVFGEGELTSDEIKGGIIFYGKGKCANCHSGPYFSDLRFHAVPLPQLVSERMGSVWTTGASTLRSTPQICTNFAHLRSSTWEQRHPTAMQDRFPQFAMRSSRTSILFGISIQGPWILLPGTSCSGAWRQSEMSSN